MASKSIKGVKVKYDRYFVLFLMSSLYKVGQAWPSCLHEMALYIWPLLCMTTIATWASLVSFCAFHLYNWSCIVYCNSGNDWYGPKLLKHMLIYSGKQWAILIFLQKPMPSTISSYIQWYYTWPLYQTGSSFGQSHISSGPLIGTQSGRLFATASLWYSSWVQELDHQFECIS